MPYRMKRLIIIRGLPGSNKIGKARELLNEHEEDCGDGEIVRAFDYFIDDNDEINFDPYYLAEAHEWAREKAFEAMRRGAHPVIACNNHVKVWEMYPYVLMGSSAGYYIEFVDMEKDSLSSLYRKTQQRVPYYKLRKWEQSYDEVCRGRAGIQQILNDPFAISKWKKDPMLVIRTAILAQNNLSAILAQNNFWHKTTFKQHQ